MNNHLNEEHDSKVHRYIYCIEEFLPILTRIENLLTNPRNQLILGIQSFKGLLVTHQLKIHDLLLWFFVFKVEGLGSFFKFSFPVFRTLTIMKKLHVSNQLTKVRRNHTSVYKVLPCSIV